MDIDGIKEIIAKDENRVLELKKTTGNSSRECSRYVHS